MFEKAARKKAKLRLALAGPSGSGKTLSALMIAGGMTGGDWSKVALIDTEHERDFTQTGRTGGSVNFSISRSSRRIVRTST